MIPTPAFANSAPDRPLHQDLQSSLPQHLHEIGNHIIYYSFCSRIYSCCQPEDGGLWQVVLWATSIPTPSSKGTLHQRHRMAARAAGLHHRGRSMSRFGQAYDDQGHASGLICGGVDQDMLVCEAGGTVKRPSLVEQLLDTEAFHIKHPPHHHHGRLDIHLVEVTLRTARHTLQSQGRLLGAFFHRHAVFRTVL